MSSASPTPKAFISYSWTSPGFQNQVRLWAERLAADGVDVVLDQYDLKEGQDKNVYMERMVIDATVTHVLMFMDRVYVEKADSRKAGVGTESQIISREVYDKVEQSKFVPIVCEKDERGQPHLPVFLGSRIWLDFSSEDAVNKNWERLIRLLHGKPLYEKPQTGRPPAYISDEAATPSSPALGKLSVFKNAFMAGQKGVKAYRRDFLDACASFIDELRPRSTPPGSDVAHKIVEDFRKLIPTRNAIVDWVLLEAETDPSDEFDSALVEFMERFLDLRGKPREVSQWSNWWYEGHRLFVYETFLYILAALLKAGAFKTLNAVLMGNYLVPENAEDEAGKFVSFASFYAYSESINPALSAKTNQRYYSQAAELVSRSCDRRDLTFLAVREADALAYLASVVREVGWYPQTRYYSGFGRSALPFFVRASQRRNFAKLVTILGIPNGDKLREIFKQRKQRDDSSGSGRHPSFEHLINLDALDTIQ
ncbi:MAG: TIR domain-containing protein [Opitutaceae bacterium]|nr:TIR domain-containing protein [Opitutaceae bacterium]